MTTYSYRKGRSFPVPAETVKNELDKLNARDGSVYASAIVKAATPNDSPIHDCFPWDDATAAHEHRLDIARLLARSVRVTTKEKPEPLPIYVHVTVPTQKEGAYKPITNLSQDEQATASREFMAQIIRAQKGFDDFKRALSGKITDDDARIIGISNALITARMLAEQLAA